MTLRDRRVLIIEDEPIIAMGLADDVAPLGAKVGAKVGTVASALDAIAATDLDGAILDVQLGREMSFRVADALAAHHIPFVFMSGCSPTRPMCIRINDPAGENGSAQTGHKQVKIGLAIAGDRRRRGMECWYRFSALGSKPLYGFGTLEQAFKFGDRLNRQGKVIYSTKAVADAEAKELRLEDNTEAFQLTVALAEKD